MKQLWFLFILVALSGSSQNWDVFNPNYRYNYKFDNSHVVSNVVFAETVSATASQTTCITNLIGITNGTVLAVDQPQLLNRIIIKLANGNFILQDPSTITIIPTCTVGQTWNFNANNSQTAICVSSFTQSIFNTIDSMKVIMVNNVDSIVLSRSFGVVQFPKYDVYVPNKYYKLVGIENKASYDPTALYGEKVPNAWDFYDYQVGSVRCYKSDWYTGIGSQGSCRAGNQIIKTKLTGSNSYVYNIDDVHMVGPMPQTCPSPFATYSTVNTSLSYTGLTSSTLTENSYPGKVLFYLVSSTPIAQIVKFGKDNTGRFYKYIGVSCQTPYDLGLAMPNYNATPYYILSNTLSAQPTIQGPGDHCWGVAKGKVVENKLYFSVSGGSKLCASCFGTVGLPDYESERSNNIVYPNPANSSITIPIENSIVFIYDVFGKIVSRQKLENRKVLDVSELPNGIYFVEIQNDSGKYSQKLLIQH
jgi:hypothetical protein